MTSSLEAVASVDQGIDERERGEETVRAHGTIWSPEPLAARLSAAADGGERRQGGREGRKGSRRRSSSPAAAECPEEAGRRRKLAEQRRPELGKMARFGRLTTGGVGAGHATAAGVGAHDGGGRGGGRSVAATENFGRASPAGAGSSRRSISAKWRNGRRLYTKRPLVPVAHINRYKRPPLIPVGM